MPNTPRTHPGKSLRDRASTAARMTARDRQRRGDAADERTARRGKRHAERQAGRLTGKPDGKPAGSGKGAKKSSKRASSPRVSKRSAKREAKESGKVHARADALAALKRRHLVGGLVLVALVLLIVMLYPMGRTYYQSLREEQRLEAQVAAVTERNEAVGKENDELKTDEGIEDAAREQGYVNPNDNAAVITNAGQAASGNKVPGKVDADSIEAPHTWYYDILDVIFFVNDS